MPVGGSVSKPVAVRAATCGKSPVSASTPRPLEKAPWSDGVVPPLPSMESCAPICAPGASALSLSTGAWPRNWMSTWATAPAGRGGANVTFHSVGSPCTAAVHGWPGQVTAGSSMSGALPRLTKGALL